MVCNPHKAETKCFAFPTSNLMFKAWILLENCCLVFCIFRCLWRWGRSWWKVWEKFRNTWMFVIMLLAYLGWLGDPSCLLKVSSEASSAKYCAPKQRTPQNSLVVSSFHKILVYENVFNLFTKKVKLKQVKIIRARCLNFLNFSR